MDFNDNDKKVIRGIANVVAERGEDWRYPNGWKDGKYIEGFKHDPDWSYEGRCYNLLPDASGACIIGSLAVDQGLPTKRVSSSGDDASDWGVSAPVGYAMALAQGRQDSGYVWGKALAAFDRQLIDLGATVDELAAIRAEVSK